MSGPFKRARSELLAQQYEPQGNKALVKSLLGEISGRERPGKRVKTPEEQDSFRARPYSLQLCSHSLLF
jgi:hypothetical protein